MKKVAVFCLILILFLVSGICACNSENDTESISASITPSVVVEPDSYEDMQNALLANNADVLIFSIDDDGNVCYNDGQFSIAELYSKIGDAVPAVRIETEEQAAALAAYLQESEAIDFFIISSQSFLIEAVKESWETVRGIYDLSSRSFKNNDNSYELAGEVCATQSQVVILSSGVSRSVVREIQARSVLVWISAETETEIWGATLTGCYGVINNSATLLLSVLEQLDENAVLRSPYIIGHRGNPDDYNENSVEGVRGAFRAGATHVEIDVHLTADKEILVMHDWSIDRTTDGTGSIAEMTLSEIRQYNLNDNYIIAGYSEVPVLSDILDILLEEEFSDKIVMIEIKDNTKEIVTKIAELLDTEKYSKIRSRLLFVTFQEGLLAHLSEILPDIPRGFLCSLSFSDYLLRLSPTNSFLDNEVNSELVSASSSEIIKNYGYAVWTWTYNDDFVFLNIYEIGAIGLSTGHIRDFSSYPINCCTSSSLSKSEAKNRAPVSLLSYDGTTNKVKGKWNKIDNSLGVFYCKFKDSSGFNIVYYTELVKVINAS